ncbi:protease HtpX [Candidatus Bathyarchaeota archaeon]|nr:MAG: protease HtpX [Candidatus Bathyarchaeota archaeon]
MSKIVKDISLVSMLNTLEGYRMSVWKLRASMIGTLAVIFGLTTLAFMVILQIFQVFNWALLIFFAVAFNVIQWLIAPYIIDALYRVKEVSRSEHPKLYEMVERLSRASGIKMPKVMLANVPIPNAFAYGSPIAGTRVAVTRGLLEILEDEEIEAVIGHELGHLKHRDVQIMMFVSMLPAIFYYLGYSLMWASMWGSREREGGASYAIIGLACIALYWILQLFTLALSRLREYYADQHSASIVEDGARKLQEGLAKIVHYSRGIKKRNPQVSSLNAFKALFISDPDRAESDAVAISTMLRGGSDQKLVQELLRRKLTTADRIMELFSTHPNIVKRLKALQELRTST